MQAAQKTRAWPRQSAHAAYLHSPRMCERKKLLPHLRTCKRAHKVKIGVAGKTRGPISARPVARPGKGRTLRTASVRCTYAARVLFGKWPVWPGRSAWQRPQACMAPHFAPRTHAIGKPGKSSLGKTAQAASRKPSTSNMSNRPDCLPARKRAARKLPCA